jgi:hypothetical protein
VGALPSRASPATEIDSRRVSFVVPTRNPEGTSVACLSSLHDQTRDYMEVVVVHSFLTDSTRPFAACLADQLLTAVPEWGVERIIGAAAAVRVSRRLPRTRQDD